MPLLMLMVCVKSLMMLLSGLDVAPPGPVDNYLLVDDNLRPKPNLKSSRDYRGVVAEVWNYFIKIYGGGPDIRRTKIYIYQDYNTVIN